MVSRGSGRSLLLRGRSWWLLLVLAWLPGPLPLAAHPGLDEQIARLSQQITASPLDTRLYLERARLHRRHHDAQAARADLDQAARLDPVESLVELERGLLRAAERDFETALVSLNHFLATRPGHVRAILARAQVLAQLGKGLEAAEDFTTVIDTASDPRPENYLERARALASTGFQFIPEAIRGLDEGLARLGPLVTLEEKAIELELQRSHYDDALNRLDRLCEPLPRKETCLVRRGGILEAAERLDEARHDFTRAIDSITKLPLRHRATGAMQELQARAEQALERLSPQGSRPPEGAGK